MKKRKSVALLIETSNAYARGVLEGIMSYMREHDLWSVYLPEQERGGKPPAWLGHWDGDGMIVRIETNEIADMVRRLHIPVIDVSAARRLPEIPFVETNDERIASLAAEHLLERGFRNLAFCGDPSFAWSNNRQDAFIAAVERSGIACDVFNVTSRETVEFDWEAEKQRMAKWLMGLKRPVGVFACYDIMAQRLLDTCRAIDLRVPEQVAILGVDNDHLLCNLCTPPLSSVIPDAYQTGREAARLLDELMRGATVSDEGFLIDPIGVATRQSTDVLAIDDADIAGAVRFIRDHACDGINVSDVLAAIPLSRRVLESRFRNIMGRTPHEEIIRQRVERVRQLLVETDLSLSKIAERTGFRHQEYLNVAFRRAMGIPPGQYRRIHGQG